MAQARNDGGNAGTPGTPGYGYDVSGYDVRLSSSDRALNGARALGGYPLDVQPDSSWPGTSAAPGQIRYQPEAMKGVADWLATQAQQSRDLPGWLSTRTAVSYGPSSWNEANNLKDAGDQVTKAVTEFTGQVLGNLAAAAGAIGSARGTYVSAEQVNTDTVDGVSSQLGGSGGAGPTVA